MCGEGRGVMMIKDVVGRLVDTIMSVDMIAEMGGSPRDQLLVCCLECQ